MDLRDSLGAPLTGFPIIINGEPKDTDQNGNVSFSGLTEDEYEITTTRNGTLNPNKVTKANPSITVVFTSSE